MANEWSIRLWCATWERMAALGARERGQSTVEYLGLALAIGVLLMAVKSGLNNQGGGVAKAFAKKLEEAVAAVGGGKG